MAAETNSGARHLLDVLAGKTNEKAFFADFTDLPEGLSETNFKRQYVDVNDSRYGEVVEEIDGCLAQVEAYAEQSVR